MSRGTIRPDVAVTVGSGARARRCASPSRYPSGSKATRARYTVDSLFPSADKVPAALYKRALSEEKLGQSAAARKHFEELVKRFPLAGESQLAKERLGTSRRR